MNYFEWLRWRSNYFKKNNNFHSPHKAMNLLFKNKKKQECQSLLDDILLKAEEDDIIHKKVAIKAGKASQAIGESWMVFHLRALKKTLDEL